MQIFRDIHRYLDTQVFGDTQRDLKQRFREISSRSARETKSTPELYGWENYIKDGLCNLDISYARVIFSSDAKLSKTSVRTLQTFGTRHRRLQ
jgi:hypothetical protein